MESPGRCQKCKEPHELGCFIIPPYDRYGSIHLARLPTSDDKVMWLCEDCAYWDYWGPPVDDLGPEWVDPEGHAELSADDFEKWILQRIAWSRIPHGTVSGYQHHKCRCGECKAAQSARVRADRAAKSRQAT